MPYSNPQNARSHVEQLMDVAITLADLTQSTELATQIPAYLSHTLEVEPITLAIVRRAADDAPAEVVLLGSSGQIATGEAAASFQRLILDIDRQAKNISENSRDLRSPFVAGGRDAGYTEITLNDVIAFPQAILFERTLDDSHRMFLIVHQASEETELTASQLDALTMIAAELTKLLRCMLTWQAHPEILGGAFERLTDREWVVLRGLNSEDGEKQLADRLGLSPHTLHSHIKSIYRKVGVQGRLPLLRRLNAALRDLRSTTLKGETLEPVESQRKASRRQVAYAV